MAMKMNGPRWLVFFMYCKTVCMNQKEYTQHGARVRRSFSCFLFIFISFVRFFVVEKMKRFFMKHEYWKCSSQSIVNVKWFTILFFCFRALINCIYLCLFVVFLSFPRNPRRQFVSLIEMTITHCTVRMPTWLQNSYSSRRQKSKRWPRMVFKVWTTFA